MPPTAEAFNRASLRRREMHNCSSRLGTPLPSAPGTSSMALLKIFGSSSGLLRADKVVAVMKYHVLRGKLGCLRIVASNAGVRMGVSAVMARRKFTDQVDGRVQAGECTFKCSTTIICSCYPTFLTKLIIDPFDCRVVHFEQWFLITHPISHVRALSRASAGPCVIGRALLCLTWHQARFHRLQ